METEAVQVKLYREGDTWCALIGEDIQIGKAGFGLTKANALRALAIEMEKAPPEIVDPNAYRKD